MNRFAGNKKFMMDLSVICIVLFSATSARAAGIHEAVQAGDPAGGNPRIEKMVDVGGRRLHCRVYGNGPPAVVLVSGLDSPQASWDSVVPDLAAMTTVVTYDRAGVGKSEIGALPAHGEQSSKDLHALLDEVGVPGPLILVGHSFGGFVVRLFASMYPEGVAGLILEETQHEDNLKELRNILKGKDLEAYDQMLVDMFREPEIPKTEADFRNITREQVRKSKPLPRVPFVILTCPDRAKAMPPVFSAGAIEAMAKLDLSLMNRLAASIPDGRHILVEGTGHYIHVDRPQALIAPVAEMIKEVRERKNDNMYMSPEQAKGKPVDKRADIWAWGCVLYECLTGNPANYDVDLAGEKFLMIKGSQATEIRLVINFFEELKRLVPTGNL